MSRFEDCCYWFSTVDDSTVGSALSGEQKADVTVVGGGFTGLWTAYFLTETAPELNVCVVEQKVCGYGASGRNAGIVSDCLDHSHALAISHFGFDEAARLAKLGIANIDELEQFATDCDFVRSGQLHVALKPEHLEDCENATKVAASVGVPPYKILSQKEMQAQLNSPLYLGGLFAPGGGILNPLKLIEKLKRRLIDRGVRFFENSPVVKIDRAEVTTAGGVIKAKKVVLATDAYTHHLFPSLLNHFIPLYDYVIVSEPLTDAQFSQIGWQNQQGVTDGRTFFNYYRPTTDRRILWGTSEAVYYPKNRVDEGCDHSEAHYTELRRSFNRHFPQLGELRFDYAWGGPIASTTRLTPFFGTVGHGDVVYGLGYTGHGIGTTRIAGKILAQLATAKHSELLNLKMVSNKPLPYPPEPLRAMAVQMVTKSLQEVDRGEKPNLLLKTLNAFGIGFSS